MKSQSCRRAPPPQNQDMPSVVKDNVNSQAPMKVSPSQSPHTISINTENVKFQPIKNPSQAQSHKIISVCVESPSFEGAIYELDTESQAARTDDRSARTDDRSARTDDRSALTDDRSACTDDRSARTDDRSARTDDRSARTDDRSARTDDRSARTDDRSACTDDRSAHTDDRSAHTDDEMALSNDRSAQDLNVGSMTQEYDYTHILQKDQNYSEIHTTSPTGNAKSHVSGTLALESAADADRELQRLQDVDESVTPKSRHSKPVKSLSSNTATNRQKQDPVNEYQATEGNSSKHYLTEKQKDERSRTDVQLATQTTMEVNPVTSQVSIVIQLYTRN